MVAAKAMELLNDLARVCMCLQHCVPKGVLTREAECLSACTVLVCFGFLVLSVLGAAQVFVFLKEGSFWPVVCCGLNGMATQEFKFQLEQGLCSLGPWQSSEVIVVRQAGRRRAALGAQPPTVCLSENPFVFLFLNCLRPISVTKEMLPRELSPGNEEWVAASMG